MDTAGDLQSWLGRVESGDWRRATWEAKPTGELADSVPVPIFHGVRARKRGQAPSAQRIAAATRIRDGASPNFRAPAHFADLLIDRAPQLPEPRYLWYDGLPDASDLGDACK